MSGILKLQGLPFKIKQEDIKEWILELSSIEPSQIHLISDRFGRSSGNAFVELKEGTDGNLILETCDEKTIGNSNRYVKIYEADQDELNWQIKRQESFKGNSNGNDLWMVRLHGLPFRQREYDIAKWFSESDSGQMPIDVQIHKNSHGKNSGDATAFFQTLEEAKTALSKDRQNLGNRYINLKLDTAAATFDLENASTSNCLIMSGVPFRATEQEMKDFFLPTKCQSVKVILNRDCRPSGEALASFEDQESLEQALTKDRENLGDRFIILRRYEERENRFSGRNEAGDDLDNGSLNKFCLKMSGLPFRATEQEMKDFFLPVKCQSIKVLLNRDLRPSGEAIASFEDEDALKQAMTKDREHLGSRFVILRRYEER